MITDDQRQQLMAFLSQHPTAVLATADAQASPGAAVVLFAEEPTGSVIFGTHPTRKYRNLKANPQTAMVITREFVAVQMHGKAVELQGEEAAQAQKLFMAKHPEADKHMMEGSVFFRFTPSWARHINTGVKPPAQWEAEL